MPIYCFRVKETGEPVNVTMSWSEYCKKVKHGDTLKLDDGRMAIRDFNSEWNNRKGKIAGWPMESDAAGVDPSQIGEAQQELAAKGVHADFNRNTGAIVFESRGHRNKCLRALGMHDRSAGYSDPEPLNR